MNDHPKIDQENQLGGIRKIGPFGWIVTESVNRPCQVENSVAMTGKSAGVFDNMPSDFTKCRWARALSRRCVPSLIEAYFATVIVPRDAIVGSAVVAAVTTGTAA
jgi:hypothetical protein